MTHPSQAPEPPSSDSATSHSRDSGTTDAGTKDADTTDNLAAVSAAPDSLPLEPGGPTAAALSDGPAGVPEADPEADPPADSDAKDRFFALALKELEAHRQELLQEILSLERRRDQIQAETIASFGGQSDAIARRVKGFQEFLVGALQDLAASAEQIELVAQPVLVRPSPLDQESVTAASPESPPVVAGVGLFGADGDLIRDQLGRFQGQPDFFADPWKLRRTLEPAGAALLENWFLEQGGRGAQPSAGSRNRNVLITAASIAILGELYGDRFQSLVLAGQPERLGEWRRGLQDCLGLSREDFGPSSGIVLFERSDALVERADRLEERGELPFIVIDAAERLIDIPILQFPLWLAFAAGPDEITMEEDLY